MREGLKARENPWSPNSSCQRPREAGGRWQVPQTLGGSSQNLRLCCVFSTNFSLELLQGGWYSKATSHGETSAIRPGLKSSIMLRGLDFQNLMLRGLDFKEFSSPYPEPQLSSSTFVAKVLTFSTGPSLSGSGSLHSGNVQVPAFMSHSHGEASETRPGLENSNASRPGFPKSPRKQGLASKAL